MSLCLCLHRRRKKLSKLILNGKRAGRKDLSALAAALNSPQIRAEKGGYLFKAGFDGIRLHLGILPWYINNERTHHYEIDLPESITEIIIGTLTPAGVFTLLFKPRQKVLSDDEKSVYRNLFKSFTAEMINIGINPESEVDKVTLMLLNSSEVMSEITAPLTFKGISCYNRQL